MGTPLRIFCKSDPINTNMIGFTSNGFQKPCILVLWMKVASAFEGRIDKVC